MSLRGPQLGAGLRINAKLAYACFLGFLAWGLWQITSPYYWGFGAIAIIVALSAAVLVATALNDIRLFILRDREIARLERQGRAMKSDGLANDAMLRDRDMLR